MDQRTIPGTHIEISVMAPAEQLDEMIALAAQRHKGQFDKGGVPYILHTLKVAHYLKTEDLELMCIAVGHDLVEDTKTTFRELLDMGFSQRVVDGIRAMTKMQGETFDEYKQKVKANADARRVKMCDLRHNTDIRRLKNKTVTMKDLERTQRYHEFYLELEAMDHGN